MAITNTQGLPFETVRFTGSLVKDSNIIQVTSSVDSEKIFIGELLFHPKIDLYVSIILAKTVDASNRVTSITVSNRASTSVTNDTIQFAAFINGSKRTDSYSNGEYYITTRTTSGDWWENRIAERGISWKNNWTQSWVGHNPILTGCLAYEGGVQANIETYTDNLNLKNPDPLNPNSTLQEHDMMRLIYTGSYGRMAEAYGQIEDIARWSSECPHYNSPTDSGFGVFEGVIESLGTNTTTIRLNGRWSGNSLTYRVYDRLKKAYYILHEDCEVLFTAYMVRSNGTIDASIPNNNTHKKWFNPLTSDSSNKISKTGSVYDHAISANVVSILPADASGGEAFTINQNLKTLASSRGWSTTSTDLNVGTKVRFNPKLISWGKLFENCRNIYSTTPGTDAQKRHAIRLYLTKQYNYEYYREHLFHINPDPNGCTQGPSNMCNERPTKHFSFDLENPVINYIFEAIQGENGHPPTGPYSWDSTGPVYRPNYLSLEPDIPAAQEMFSCWIKKIRGKSISGDDSCPCIQPPATQDRPNRFLTETGMTWDIYDFPKGSAFYPITHNIFSGTTTKNGGVKSIGQNVVKIDCVYVNPVQGEPELVEQNKQCFKYEFKIQTSLPEIARQPVVITTNVGQTVHGDPRGDYFIPLTNAKQIVRDGMFVEGNGLNAFGTSSSNLGNWVATVGSTTLTRATGNTINVGTQRRLKYVQFNGNTDFIQPDSWVLTTNGTDSITLSKPALKSGTVQLKTEYRRYYNFIDSVVDDGFWLNPNASISNAANTTLTCYPSKIDFALHYAYDVYFTHRKADGSLKEYVGRASSASIPPYSRNFDVLVTEQIENLNIGDVITIHFNGVHYKYALPFRNTVTNATTNKTSAEATLENSYEIMKPILIELDRLAPSLYPPYTINFYDSLNRLHTNRGTHLYPRMGEGWKNPYTRTYQSDAALYFMHKQYTIDHLKISKIIQKRLLDEGYGYKPITPYQSRLIFQSSHMTEFLNDLYTKEDFKLIFLEHIKNQHTLDITDYDSTGTAQKEFIIDGLLPWHSPFYYTTVNGLRDTRKYKPKDFGAFSFTNTSGKTYDGLNWNCNLVAGDAKIKLTDARNKLIGGMRIYEGNMLPMFRPKSNSFISSTSTPPITGKQLCPVINNQNNLYEVSNNNDRIIWSDGQGSGAPYGKNISSTRLNVGIVSIPLGLYFTGENESNIRPSVVGITGKEYYIHNEKKLTQPNKLSHIDFNVLISKLENSAQTENRIEYMLNLDTTLPTSISESRNRETADYYRYFKDDDFVLTGISGNTLTSYNNSTNFEYYVKRDHTIPLYKDGETVFNGKTYALLRYGGFDEYTYDQGIAMPSKSSPSGLFWSDLSFVEVGMELELFDQLSPTRKTKYKVAGIISQSTGPTRSGGIVIETIEATPQPVRLSSLVGFNGTGASADMVKFFGVGSDYFYIVIYNKTTKAYSIFTPTINATATRLSFDIQSAVNSSTGASPILIDEYDYPITQYYMRRYGWPRKTFYRDNITEATSSTMSFSYPDMPKVIRIDPQVSARMSSIKYFNLEIPGTAGGSGSNGGLLYSEFVDKWIDYGKDTSEKQARASARTTQKPTYDTDSLKAFIYDDDYWAGTFDGQNYMNQSIEESALNMQILFKDYWFFGQERPHSTGIIR